MIRAFDNVASGPYRITGASNQALRELTLEDCEALLRERTPIIIADEIVDNTDPNMTKWWRDGDASVMPPFEHIWIEAGVGCNGISSLGISVLTREADDEERSALDTHGLPEDARNYRIMELRYYYQRVNGRCEGPIHVIHIALNSWGQLIQHIDEPEFVIISAMPGTVPINHVEVTWILNLTFCVFMMLNAPNSRLEEAGQTQDRLSKKIREANRFPELRHRIIKFKHGKGWVRADGSDVRTGLGGFDHRRALHWVRGHFKDFREKGVGGNPKARGIYWVPAHLRGDARKGMVTKDYEVSAPREGESDS